MGIDVNRFLHKMSRHMLGARRHEALQKAYWTYCEQVGSGDKASEVPASGVGDAWERSLARMKQFKNRHAGQRCFIIGNGPSLRQMDLSPLKDEWTFGSNRIYLLFPKLGFPTSFLVSINRLVLEQCVQDIAALTIPKFLSWDARDVLPEDEKTIFVRINHDVGFSAQPARGFCPGATVTFTSMQLAYYMGFSAVYLIGVDHSFATKGPAHELVVSDGGDPNHFDPDYFGKGFRWQLPDLEMSELAYRIAKFQFENHNREIFDATVGGKLDLFTKVDFNSLF